MNKIDAAWPKSDPKSVTLTELRTRPERLKS
jgi:hypothetical protein